MSYLGKKKGETERDLARKGSKGKRGKLLVDQVIGRLGY